MPKASYGHFETSWARPALTFIDHILESGQWSDAEDLMTGILETRSLLSGVTEISVEAAMESIEQSREKIAEGTRRDVKGIFVANRLTDQIRAAFYFLKDLHDSHKDRLNDRMNEGDEFTPISLSTFRKSHPEHRFQNSGQHGRLNEYLRSAFGADYRSLLNQMGFPVVADMKDVGEMARKVEEELWRIYNTKNGFPRENRTYYPDTQLPKFAETVYGQRFFDKTFGGFREAVKTILLHSELRETEKAERLSDSEIRAALEHSLEVGGIPAEYKENAAAISAALEKEFLTAIDALTIPTENNTQDRRLCQHFNWRHLLFACPYLREYGIKIYDIWIGMDRLEIMSNHPKKALSRQLKKLFFGPQSPVAYMRDAPKLFRVDEEDIDFLGESEDYNALDYAYDELDLDFEEGHEPNADQVLEVLKVFHAEGITIPPKRYHFVHSYSLWPERCLSILKEKAAFFEEHPEIPFYMRQILFAAARTTVEDIETKRAVFDAEGVPPEHSAHFLHLIGTDHLPKAARMLGRTLDSYEAIREAHAKKEAEAAVKDDPVIKLIDVQELLASHLPRKHVPSVDELQALGINPRTIRRRVEKLLQGGQPVTREVLDKDYMTTVFQRKKRALKPAEEAAKAELRVLGYPFEKVALHKRVSATTVLHKVRLMEELMGRVYITLLSHSDEHIVQEAIKLQKEQDLKDENEKELLALFRERGLDAPDWIWPFGSSMILKKIRHIEANGVAFTPINLQRGFVHWSWINLGPGELNRKIADQRNNMRTAEKWAQLEALFDLDMATMPTSLRNKTPDQLWRYLKALDMAGMDLEDIGPSAMNAHGLAAFKIHLAQILQRLAHRGTRLSSKQASYIGRYEAAAHAEEQYGWEDAYDLLLSLPSKTFEEAVAVIHGRTQNRQKTDALHESLQQELADQKMRVMKLLRGGANYAELETHLV